MNLLELGNLLEKKLHFYKDYTLQEYEFLRYFLNQVSPETIEVIGGHTNLDLFYACQDIAPTIINHDPFHSDESRLLVEHQKLQQTFNFQGKYTWLQHTVLSCDQLFDCKDTLMLNSHQDIIYELIEKNQLPDHVIFSHYGKIWFAENMVELNKYRKMICCGDRLAFFTNQDINLESSKFHFKTHRNFFDVQPVHILIK